MNIFLDWHTFEKWLMGGIAAFLAALLTVLRPWLAKQMFKLHRENAAEFRELIKDLLPASFKRIDTAFENAEQALHGMADLKERMEHVESASQELGVGLAEIKNSMATLDRIESGLTIALGEMSNLRSSFARLDERTKKEHT